MSGLAAAPKRWFDSVVLELLRQLRWSYLPPLMVYLAAGVSGLTAIVGTFFVKDYLGLSAAFLAGLAFWTGIPWVLKMPLGHLVDLIWRFKGLMVFAGAGLIAASIAIMYALISHPEAMEMLAPRAAWFVLAAILAPSGYVIQDVVADAMTVEAVPAARPDGTPYTEAETKAMHTTMQTLGRFAIISGAVLVAGINIFMFSGVEKLSLAEQAAVYARIYLMALVIPAISVAGVVLAEIIRRRRPEAVGGPTREEADKTEPNWWILGGGAAFVAFAVIMGASDIPFGQEITFAGSMAIVLVMLNRLLKALSPDAARMLIGTAIIIFAFRAVPLPGPGLTWFEIDVLDFDQQFISVLSLITSALTLAGLVVFRPLMARRSIVYIVALLTLIGGVLALPNLGLYYGIQQWTAPATGGIVDARFIAVIDTAVESPLGQVAMIPMLAWIARNAPENLKATFFAVMASFTNLALSAASLGTKYVNQIFLVTREVRDPDSGAVTVAEDYSELGLLLIAVAAAGVLIPLVTIALVQASRFRTTE